MNIKDVVSQRKSIRGYKKDPVPVEIIKDILSMATRSPSSVNTQPWEFTIVKGDILDSIGRLNIEKLVSGEATTPNVSYQNVYKERQVKLAVGLFELMGIGREDKDKRLEWIKKGFRFFDAPVAIIISTDKSLDDTWSLFDIGAISQTICLLALNYGLGTCIEGQGVMYPDVVRKFTGIPDSKRLVIGIAMGYPDDSFPANSLKSERVEIEQITSWCGFD